jgi:hypothetical protein
LGDTLIQFFLFVKAIKKEYPTKNLFFSCGSFGGTKGALINLILSNKENLTGLFEKNFQYLADRLSLFFQENPDITPDLIKGYILHDGGYNYFWSRGNVINTYFVSNPMLLLQNFDDERVTTDQMLGFYQKLKEGKTTDTNLFVHITPQGASSSLQKGDPLKHDPGFTTSLEGHFRPEVEKYRNEYDQKVLEFLRHANAEFATVQNECYKAGINQMRAKHAATLWDAKGKYLTDLYRLYYANLHNEKSPNTLKMVDRLSKTCAQYAAYFAKQYATQTRAEHYTDIVNNYGFRLIAKIFDKNAKTIKAVGKFIATHKTQAKELIDEMRSSPRQEVRADQRSNSPTPIIKNPENQLFVVTEE